MSEEGFIATHEGRFYLCPVWLKDVESGEPTVIAKYRLKFLFDIFVEFDLLIKYLVSLFHDDLELKFFFKIKKLRNPKKII